MEGHAVQMAAIVAGEVGDERGLPQRGEVEIAVDDADAGKAGVDGKHDVLVKGHIVQIAIRGVIAHARHEHRVVMIRLLRIGGSQRLGVGEDHQFARRGDGEPVAAERQPHGTRQQTGSKRGLAVAHAEQRNAGRASAERQRTIQRFEHMQELPPRCRKSSRVG